MGRTFLVLKYFGSPANDIELVLTNHTKTHSKITSLVDIPTIPSIIQLTIPVTFTAMPLQTQIKLRRDSLLLSHLPRLPSNVLRKNRGNQHFSYQLRKPIPGTNIPRGNCKTIKKAIRTNLLKRTQKKRVYWEKQWCSSLKNDEVSAKSP